MSAIVSPKIRGVNPRVMCPACRGSKRSDSPAFVRSVERLPVAVSVWCPCCTGSGRSQAVWGTLLLSEYHSLAAVYGWSGSPRYLDQSPDDAGLFAPANLAQSFAYVGFGAVCDTRTGEVLDARRESLHGVAVEAARRWFGVPRLCNTGYENTSVVLVDWLGVTFPVSVSRERVLELFAPSGGSVEWSAGKGGYRYAHSLRRGNVAVYWGGDWTRDTVHVEVSGQGCRQLEGEGVVTDWVAFLRLLFDHYASFSRVDLAYDDTSGAINLDFIESEVKADRLCTHFGTGIITTDLKSAADGGLTGKTLAWGKRGNPMFVRMYHKGAEQFAKLPKEEQTAEKAEKMGGWVRIEIEARDNRADKMAQGLVQFGAKMFGRTLWALLDFKDVKSADSNRSRRETASWWLDIVNATEKMRLGSRPELRTVEKFAGWLQKTAACALATVFLAPGGGWGFVEALLREGEKNLNSRHTTALAVANAEKSKSWAIKSLY